MVVGTQCGGSDAFSGVTRQPGSRLCLRSVRALRRHGDVLRSHRST
ncbi:hypothetical protein ACNF2C_11010 [Enterobacter hormaechei]